MAHSAAQWQPLVLALLVYPLLEEVVFRFGLLRWADLRMTAPPWMTNGLVSMVFAASHAFSFSARHAAAVVAPSLLLGWLWQRYGSLVVCTAAHACMNGLYLFVLPAAWRW